MSEYGEALIWEMQDLIEANYIQSYEDWENFTDIMCETAMNFFQDKMLEAQNEMPLRIIR